MRRHRGSVARGKPRREPYDRVMIVCEGSKTELLYFRGLYGVTGSVRRTSSFWEKEQTR